jgi:hypothetical protein
MKRRIQGLHEGCQRHPGWIVPGPGRRGQISLAGQKPYYVLQFSVLEPKHLAERSITGRLYCTAKALWKLSWFLRDFGYDTELLGRDEVDEKALVGLRGVVKISHTVTNGASWLNLAGFAPASQWEELSSALPAEIGASEVTR